MKIKRYTIKHLTDDRQSHDPNSWVDGGHTLTLISRDENDHSKDDLFVDHHHIHRKNWDYVHNHNQLVWQQDAQGLQTDYLAGHVGFADGHEEGAGSMQLGDQRTAVHASYLHASYTIDLSSNAGAYVATDGLTLKWNTTSSEWQNANWDTGAMTFTYWIEKAGKVGDQQLYQTAVVFENKTPNATWNVLPRGPGDSGAFSSNLSGSREFTFKMNAGYTPQTGPHFPFRMAFQFDQLAQNIIGGAMLCGQDSTKGTVYALRGKTNNPLVFGTYSLSSEDGKETGNLTTHGGKLVVDGKKIESSSVTGNRLAWENVSSPHLPSCGHADFSEDGSKITASSFAVVGNRNEAVLGAANSSSNQLRFQDLLNMNPFTTNAKGQTQDSVKQAAMEDFYKFIQYYMPADYLHNFIASQPPDLGQLANIAQDNSANGAFYSSLAVPYLTNAISLNKHKDVDKLNARRADKKLKKGITSSTVYKRHAGRLYSYEWQKKFPMMTRFLIDQQTNASTHNSAIDSDLTTWKQQLQSGIAGTTDPQEQQHLTQMLGVAETAASNGKSGKYWAYIMFRYLTSPSYLTMLEMILMNGNTSQTLTQDIMRYSSVLSILDETGYFTQEFANVVNIFQLAGVLPTLLDHGNNSKDFNFFTEMILNAFIKKYVNSQDPQMSQRAKVVANELRIHSMQDYLSILNVAAGTNPAWSDMALIFENKAASAFGKVGGAVARMMSMSAVVFGIILMSTGMIKWSEMTPTQQTAFVLASLHTLVFLFRKGVEVYAAKVAGGWWEAFKVFFYKDLTIASDTMTSSFGKWLTGKTTAADRALLMDASFVGIDEGYFTKIMGRNLSEFMATRFAAALSIVGIVLSSISLHQSTSGLDKAMNSLLLASSILDLVAALSTWAVASGTETIAAVVTTLSGTVIGELGFAAIASCCSGLAIAGAIAGIIIMIIIMSKHKNPPDPVQQFIDSQAVKNAGLYMPYGTEIDYFQVINDQSGLSRDIGAAISPVMSGPLMYLFVHPDGSVSLHGLTYGYSSVLSLSTDEFGYCKFLTKVWDSNKKAQILSLTLDENKNLKMTAAITDPTKTKQQQWVVTCMGNVQKTSNGILESANFNIYNLFHGTSYYLNGTGVSVTTSATAQNWNFSMQPMKPEELSFQDIVLSTFDKDRKFFPYLLQSGSSSGKVWSVSPALPSWLTLDTSTGIISQAAGVSPPQYTQTSYTITVNNAYGSASAGFNITVMSTF